MNRHTFSCSFFQNMSYYFWMITEMKNVNNSKGSTSGCSLAFAWFFFQFQLGVACKSVAFEKSVYYVKIKMMRLHFFCKQLRSGLSPQNCLYFQGFWGTKLLNGCFVVWPSTLCLREMQYFSGFKIDIYEQWF